MNDTEYQEYLKSEKWKAIAAQRMKIDNYQCCMCGSRGTAQTPLEIHHLSYKHIGNEENRVYEDLVTVCHACHKGVHALMNRQTAPNGRRGWKNGNIPQVSVYTLTGNMLESREV